jgi:hypothetical protein
MAMMSWCDRFIEAFGEEIVEKKKVESEAIESQWLGQGNTFEVKLFIRVKGDPREFGSESVYFHPDWDRAEVVERLGEALDIGKEEARKRLESASQLG